MESKSKGSKRGWLAKFLPWLNSGAESSPVKQGTTSQQTDIGDTPALQVIGSGITAAQLKAVPFFKNCPDSGLEQLAPRFKSESFPAGSRVIKKGDVADKFYILVRGEARVSEMRPNSDKLYLAKLSELDCMGEIALLRGRNRMADVETVGPCVFMTLERQEFLDAVDAMPALRATVEQIIEERVSADERAELLRNLAEI